MMGALLQELTEQGFTITTDGTMLEIYPASCLTDPMVQLIKSQKTDLIRELQSANDPPPLSDRERAEVNRWMTHLGETSPDIRAEFMQAAERDAKCRADYLRWASEIPKPEPQTVNAYVWGSGERCIDCRHFRRYDHHPHLGSCSEGVRAPPAGHWDRRVHSCETFQHGSMPHHTQDEH